MIHFEYYPNIEYSNNLAKNILVRGKIRDAVLRSGSLYYKYSVEDYMRPETIAERYYGSPNYVWIIYYANNIFDPIHEWVKTPAEFESYVAQKYGTLEGAMRMYNSDGKILWDNIKHCVEYDPDTKATYIIDRPTFEKKMLEGNKNVSLVTFYDYEKELNESKRNIIVLDKVFLSGILNELRNLFSET